MATLIKKVGPGDLNVLTCGGKYSVPLSLFESGRFEQFLKTMDEMFDYVILDAPPMPRFPECRVLCTKVDGVILVIEAGNTRRQVALRAKSQLEEAGGRLLGVVLNRRKHYIPEWVYKRL
jgi:Mrp family chromosome partitioning ATPase